MTEETEVSELEKQLLLERKSCWETWDEDTRNEAMAFAEGYKAFISKAKTERLAVEETKRLAEEQGFVPFETVEQGGAPLVSGAKVYAINRQKDIILAVMGKKPLTDGAHLILAHIDSPRIDLKMHPLYEDEYLGLLKTHYYGGIKKYQWPALPLAMHGVVVLSDGSKVNISIGEDPADPVFIITDLLPHLAEKQMAKQLREAIEAEELNLVVGSIPYPDKKARTKIKLNIMKLLNDRYGITEEDLISADIEIVPAGPARDLGFDRSLITGYGHDDRSCAYTSIQSLFAQSEPEYTCVAVLTDKEETGSASNTGITSIYLYDFLSRLLAVSEAHRDGLGVDVYLRRALANSCAVSADVANGMDPTYKSVHDEKNAARLGCGVVLEKYTGARGKYGTSEANAEFMAKMRQIFNSNDIVWQTGAIGRVDLGGGGTVAMYLAEYNMDIVDCGPAVLNMHAPYEIVSKADLYSAYQAYKAFLGSA